MMNPKAWEAISGFTGDVEAATERLEKLIAFFPENGKRISETSAQLNAECAGIIKSLLTEALAGVDVQMAASPQETRTHTDHTAGASLSSPEQATSTTRGGAIPPERAVIVVKEAAGKRVRELRVEEIDPGLDQFQVSIAFDDSSTLFVALTVIPLTPSVNVRLDFSLMAEGEGVQLEYPDLLLRQHKSESTREFSK
jgi:hypothetical protein